MSDLSTEQPFNVLSCPPKEPEEIQDVIIDHLKQFYGETASVGFSSPWGKFPELRTQDLNLCLYRVLDFRNRNDIPDITSMYHDSNQPPYRCHEVSIYDLFSPVQHNLTQITLVESDVHEQRLLCWKLLYDWSTKTMVSSPFYVNKFTVIIYVDCLQVSTLSDIKPSEARERLVSLVNILFNPLIQEKKCSCKDICDWLVSIQNEVLVILDNFDYVNDSGKEDLRGILSSLCLPEAQLLISCRPRFANRQLCDQMFLNVGLQFHCSFVFLQEMLLSDFSALEVSLLIQKVRKDLVLTRILRNVYTLVLLAWLIIDNHAKPKTNSIYHLYRELTQCALSRYYTKFQILPERHLISVVLKKLSTLSVKMWKSERSFCSPKEIDSHFWQLPNTHLGFFVEAKLLPLQNSTSYYMFPSTNFLEYFVSVYIAEHTDRYERDNLLEWVLSREMGFLWVVLTGSLMSCYDEDAVRCLLDVMANMSRKKCVGIGIFDKITRGNVHDYDLCLECLSQIYFPSSLMNCVVEHFPDVLEFHIQRCPPQVLENFCRLARLCRLRIRGITLHLDGMEDQYFLCISLAHAINRLENLTTLLIHCESVFNSQYIVDIVCEIFKKNKYIRTLSFCGEMNRAGNFTPIMYKKVRSVFTSDIALRMLCIDNIHNRHRLAYILNVFPHIFEKIELARCDLESATENLVGKIKFSKNFSSFSVSNCVTSVTSVNRILEELLNCEGLRKLNLSLLSPLRNFNCIDIRSGAFKVAVDDSACEKIKQMILNLPQLTELILCQNRIGDQQVQLILQAIIDTGRLEHLDLSGNVIGDASGSLLQKMMTECSSLNVLWLCSNDFSESMRKQLLQTSIGLDQLKLIVERT
ncbi:Hypothetical predicted protein [Octopus vulgaris]|uniref:NACHT domain-containing protein n=2 Tax=Octopus vulgaris TaxID=6645 RepID=A0AA36BMM2_OCTVU|nr:Hypothetical predicted protein [Octopus vulgaris]